MSSNLVLEGNLCQRVRRFWEEGFSIEKSGHAIGSGTWKGSQEMQHKTPRASQEKGWECATEKNRERAKYFFESTVSLLRDLGEFCGKLG